MATTWELADQAARNTRKSLSQERAQTLALGAHAINTSIHLEEISEQLEVGNILAQEGNLIMRDIERSIKRMNKDVSHGFGEIAASIDRQTDKLYETKKEANHITASKYYAYWREDKEDGRYFYNRYKPVAEQYLNKFNTLTLYFFIQVMRELEDAAHSFQKNNPTPQRVSSEPRPLPPQVPITTPPKKKSVTLRFILWFFPMLYLAAALSTTITPLLAPLLCFGVPAYFCIKAHKFNKSIDIQEEENNQKRHVLSQYERKLSYWQEEESQKQQDYNDALEQWNNDYSNYILSRVGVFADYSLDDDWMFAWATHRERRIYSSVQTTINEIHKNLTGIHDLPPLGTLEINPELQRNFYRAMELQRAKYIES